MLGLRLARRPARPNAPVRWLYRGSRGAGRSRVGTGVATLLAAPPRQRGHVSLSSGLSKKRRPRLVNS
jgi:hypothetical protein